MIKHFIKGVLISEHSAIRSMRHYSRRVRQHNIRYDKAKALEVFDLSGMD